MEVSARKRSIARDIYKYNNGRVGWECSSRQTGSPCLYNWLLNSVGHDRLDVHNSTEQIVNDLLALLVANVLDLLQLDIVLLVGIFLGLLVAAGVLSRQWSELIEESTRQDVAELDWLRRTSVSNFLNSSSFFWRYSSISFWASLRASFTRFVRSGVIRFGQCR